MKRKKQAHVAASGSGPGVVNRVTMKYGHRTDKRLRTRGAKQRFYVSEQKESA